MTAPKMTFDQFRAAGTDCDDLGTALHDSMWDDCPTRGRGRLYEGLWIERKPEAGWLNGRPEEWFLLTCDDDMLSDDLVELEARLYAYALSDLHISPPPFDRSRLAALIFKVGIGFHADTLTRDYSDVLTPHERAEMDAQCIACFDAGYDANEIALEVLDATLTDMLVGEVERKARRYTST